MREGKAVNVTEEALSVGWGMGGLGPVSGIVWRNQRPGVSETGWSTCRACVRPLTVDPVEKYTVSDSL